MKPIRLSKSTITDKDIDAVVDVLKREYLGMGVYVKEFEDALISFIGRPAVCVNSGTGAIQLALQAAGIGDGDEVLVQSLTFIATFQAISATGATPIPCEINLNDLTIDLEDAESRITSRTKAIIPMHYSGNPGNLNKIYQFAEKHKLRIIEDAAHAFGTNYQVKKIGNQGDIVCFSFDGVKNITSGEGGAIVTNDKDILEKVQDLRLLGVCKDTEKRYKGERSWDFDVTRQGWRYHMSNIMAAIGRSQLERFGDISIHRKYLAKKYVEELYNVEGIELLDCNYDDVVPHIFVIKIKNDKRDQLKYFLDQQGIQTGIHYKPNHLLSFYNHNKTDNLPKTEAVYKEILTLPLHLDLMYVDVKRISNLIKDFIIYKSYN